MERPRPKELVVRIISESVGSACITFGSEDARAWVERKCGQFGRLTKRDDVSYDFYAHENYDFREIVAFLNSYNDPR